MKKIIFKSLVLLIVLISFLGCSSSSDSCTPIVCQNAGTSNSDCGCNCPQGFTGTDCATQLIPSKIKITKFTVTKFNNTNGSSNWDNNSAPDIFLQLINGTNGSNIWLSTIYYPDAVSTGTNSFDFIPTTPVEITNTLGQFTLFLGDDDVHDMPSNPNDQMAAILFNIYSGTSGFPQSMNITNNASIPFRVTLSLQYEW